MDDIDFERRLERMFAEAAAPTAAEDDAEAFAGQVFRRLDRGWNARTWLIGAAGVAGGVIGASQLVMGGLLQRLEAARESLGLLRSDIGGLPLRADWLDVASAGGGVVWVAVALAVVMLGFALTRVIEEI